MVHGLGITPRYRQQSWQKHSCHRTPERPGCELESARNTRRQGTAIFHGSQQQEHRQHRPRTKEQHARQATAIAMTHDLPPSDGAVYARGFQKNKDLDERRCHRHWSDGCSRCKLGASHIDGATARGPCHRVRFSARANQCAATAAAMQPGRGGHWTIKLPSSDFLLAAAGAAATTRPAAAATTAAKAVVGTKPAATAAAAATVAVTVEPPPQPTPPSQATTNHSHQHHSQWALQNYMQLVCRDKRGGASQLPQQQQQQRHKQTRLADVVAAGSFYTATAATSYWQQQQQQLTDDSYVVYRTTAAEQRVFQQVGSYAPWRDMRPKIGCLPIRQTTCADGDGHHEPSEHLDDGFTHQGQLQSFLAFQHQEHQQQQNWDQDSYLPYQDGVPGINGQGDGDAPAYGGGAVALGGADGADVLRDEQDEVVALLAEIDERHEKHLAFERVLQEREPTFWRHRWRTQTQFPSQHLLFQQQVIDTAGSCDSVDVFVDGGVWRSVSDNGLYDRSDRRLCPPFRVVQSRTSSVFFARFAADDITARYGRTTSSPTPPPSMASPPSPVPVVAVVTSTPPPQDCPEPENTAASTPPEDKNENCVEPKCGEPKCGEEASGGKVEEKASPLTVHRDSPVQVKEAACALPATKNQQPPQHVQRQEPVDASAIHQQRKAHNDYRRSTYQRREYHSTRRYNEHDHSTPPPPSSLDRAPGAGRQYKTTDGGRFPQNGQCRQAFNNRPPPNHHHHSDGGAYARGQHQPPRGGSHSANRNRNRPNNNNRQCNGANHWNKDRARQDAGPDVGNRGGFAGHRSSLPYCCRSVAGGSRVASPADASAATPPPSHRGRRYNNKQGAGGSGGCGGQAQAQRQYSATKPSPQRVPPTSRDNQSAGAKSVAAVDNNGGRPPSNRKPNGDASSRKPRRQQQQQRADYNQPRCASSKAGESATTTSPTLGSRKSCESLPTGCGNGDAAMADSADGDLPDDGQNRRSMSLRMFWERTNLTIFRRRTSQ